MAAVTAHAQSDKPKEFRVGVLGGENTQDRVTRHGKFQELLEDMKGHSLALADPNSTSGHLIPSATLKSQGIKLDDGAYFSKTGFSGGHEQGVVAVLDK